MNFTSKQDCRDARAKMQEALELIEEELGVKIEVGGASYTANNCTFKVTLSAVGDDGTATTPEAESFLAVSAAFYNLKPEALGETFKSRGKTYTIVGCKRRSPKFPILATNAKGQTYKFSDKDVDVV